MCQSINHQSITPSIDLHSLVSSGPDNYVRASKQLHITTRNFASNFLLLLVCASQRFGTLWKCETGANFKVDLQIDWTQNLL